MHHLASSSFLFLSAVPHRFKYRQNAPFSVLVFKMFSAVPNIFERQNAPFTVLVFNMFYEVPYRIRCRQNAPFIVLVFESVSAVPNRFKFHQNAPFIVHVFKIVSAVPNRFKYRQNAPFSVFVFKIILRFRIVLNTVRMHPLLSLFSNFLSSSKSLQMV